MKYLEALKVFNKGKEWCSPRKGTPDHAKVMLIMKGNNTQLPSSSATSMATTKSPSVKSATKSSTKAPSIKSNVAQGSSIKVVSRPKSAPARIRKATTPKPKSATPTSIRSSLKGVRNAIYSANKSKTESEDPASGVSVRSSLRKMRQSLFDSNLSKTESSSTGVSSIPDISASSSLTQVEKSSSKRPKTTDMQFKQAKVIQAFLKNKLVLTKYNLQTRIQRYNLIRKRLEELEENDCLEKKMFGTNEGYTIDGFLNLEKKIGTNSVYGAIYLTSMPQMLGVYPIASKVMEITTDNETETKINAWIAEKILLTKQSKHFVFMYKSTKCPFYASQMNRLRKEERLVDYNELCNGDLSSLMKTEARNDGDTMINMVYQVFIAIATYQNRVGFVHKDTHHGNFLYQENNEVGYYHYIYKGLDFYIKSCKYNMLIFDFGLSDNIGNVDSTLKYKDYLRIIHGFISSKTGDRGWIDDDMDMNVNIDMVNIRSELKNIFAKVYRNNPFDFFGGIIEDIFKKFKTNTGIFTTARPAKVLNETPFIINKVEPYPKINFRRTSNILGMAMRR